MKGLTVIQMLSPLYSRIVSFLCIIFVVNCTHQSKYKLHNVSSDMMKHFEDTYPELFSRKYQGDILQLKSDVSNDRNAIRDEKFHWPNGILPYEFHPDFDEEEKHKITKAMTRLSSQTCVKFVPHKNEVHYTTIYRQPKAGCFAVIGYHSEVNTSHIINLESPGCLKHQGTIEHELLHLVGLYHEQSRADRDDYVSIYWGNITEENQFNFRKASDDEAVTHDIPYDIGSVMHYPRFAFSKNGNDTIIYKKDPEKEMGQRVGATENDLTKVRKMYKCEYKHEPSPGEWFMNKVQTIIKNPF